MKKYFLLVALLFFCPLKSLEQVQNNQTSLASFLSTYLEPANPLKEYTPDPFFNIMCNFEDTVIPGLLLETKAICSFPFINICINLFNECYPDTFLNPLHKANLNIISKTTFNFCNQFFNEEKVKEEENKTIVLNLSKALIALAIPLIAHYNNPQLFVRHTYLTVYDAGRSNLYNANRPFLAVLFPYAYKVCKNKIKGFSEIVHPIECIFEAKKIMFFILTVLACCKIKLKNTKFLTNPTYWLPIGILHALYVNKKFAFLILNQKDVCCMPDELYYKLKNSYNKNTISDQVLSYGCTYIIPITGVLVSAIIPDLTK